MTFGLAVPAAMLAMQAKPKEQLPQPGPSQQQQPPEQQQQADSTSTAAADKPLVLLLDVQLDAPVLLMPLTSISDDHIEIDLGTLQLTNRVVWEMHTDVKQKLLMDEMEVRKSPVLFSGAIRVRMSLSLAHTVYISLYSLLRQSHRNARTHKLQRSAGRSFR